MQSALLSGYSPCPAHRFNSKSTPPPACRSFGKSWTRSRALAASGRLAPEQLLPSIRQLATDLEVNMMTISKAYARLEAEGVLERHARHRMRIRPAAIGGSVRERQEELAPLAEALVAHRPARSFFGSNHFGRSHCNSGASNVPEPTIDIRDLKKSFGLRAVLTGVTLEVPPGAVVGLMGTNGAGKSTLIKCLLNLLHPDSGTCRLLDCDTRNLSPAVKEQLGYVPQVVYLYPWMKVRHVIGYTASFYAHWNHAWSDELVRRWHVPLDTPSRAAFDRATANIGPRVGLGSQT